MVRILIKVDDNNQTTGVYQSKDLFADIVKLIKENNLNLEEIALEQEY